MSDETSRLTDKQRRFIEEYCADFNATAASDRDIRSLRSPWLDGTCSDRIRGIFGCVAASQKGIMQ